MSASLSLVSSPSPVASLASPVDWHVQAQFRKAIFTKYPQLNLPRYLLAPEIRQLAALPINHHHRMLMLMLFNTGGRINEVLDLTPNRITQTPIDVGGHRQLITTVTLRTLKQQRRGKSGNASKDAFRVVTLYDPDFAAELIRYKVTFGKNERLPLFRNHDPSHAVRVHPGTGRKRRNEQAICDQTARNWLAGIERQAKVAGIELTLGLTPRVLRHSCAIHMLLNGLSREQVRIHLGHRSERNTAIYTQLLGLDTNLLTQFHF